HSITASGVPWTGYFAYSNLFLHPGIDRTTIGIVSYNHQIDVHGTQTCGNGESYNCGPAGQYFEVQYNTVLSTDADAIQLRGTPTDGMHVGGNVFEQSADHALTHTETALGLFDAGNTYNSTAFYDASRSCDFDGDGVPDSFRASGVNWW